MTLETRYFISPADICGVEFQCPHCGARIAYKLGTSDRLPTACQNCREPLLIERSPSYTALKNFIGATKVLQDTYFGFVFRVEIVELAEKIG